MAPFFSHNPNDLVDWIWVVVAFVVVIGVFVPLGLVAARYVRMARAEARGRSRADEPAPAEDAPRR